MTGPLLFNSAKAFKNYLITAVASLFSVSNLSQTCHTQLLCIGPPHEVAHNEDKEEEW